ncbi:uncharacterized protein BJX67DRAFT_340346 [Aspergillus lucknowensis]|uniref:Uncharacterized protein n=1 Tax=Aspergillus lucknowensis TaxID=176173 RepID=A0ABR4M868_9EURO
MSRNFIPAVLAIGMGIATGYYTFQPALRDLQDEGEKGSAPQLGQSQSATQQQSQSQKSAPSPTSPAPPSSNDGSAK